LKLTQPVARGILMNGKSKSDPLYDLAVRWVATVHTPTAENLSKAVRVGLKRAQRMLEKMEGEDVKTLKKKKTSKKKKVP